MYNQNAILLSLYRFRFATQDQLRQLLNHTSHAQISKLLKVLIKHKVVECIEGKSVVEPNVYFLTPIGLGYIKDHADTFSIPSIPRHLHRNLEVSKALVDRSIKVLTVYLSLKKQYGNELTYTSKIELGPRYPLKPAPDGFAIIKDQQFILEYVSDEMWRTLLRRRLYQLYTYWQLNNDVKYLIATESSASYERVNTILDSLDDSFVNDCIFKRQL